ncbi:MAG: hypothetical protein ABTA16_16955 [Niallia sp.]
MGITLYSKNKSIDMGYFGFSALRNTVAELAHEKLYAHYKELYTHVPYSEPARTEFFEHYDKKTDELIETLGVPVEIYYFLYASDCEASMSYKVCKELYKLIKEHDDNVCYGYFGRTDCAMFKDFKEIVEECAKNRHVMRWY